MQKIIDEIIAGRDLSIEDHRRLVENITKGFKVVKAPKPVRTEDHIDIHGACFLSGLTKHYVNKKIKEASFPCSVLQVGKTHLWSRREVEAWIKEQSEPTVFKPEPTPLEKEIEKMAGVMVNDARKAYE